MEGGEERERERERERAHIPCGAAVDEVVVDEYDVVDFVAGESNNFDDALSDVVDDSPPNPLPVAVVEVLVPNELKRSPKEDIRSPPRLPSPMSPRPLDEVGLNRDELVGAAAAVELEVPFVDDEVE